jgi:3-methyladenine DNA glycosylase/8-oxoguanine DNA glycosylase
MRPSAAAVALAGADPVIAQLVAAHGPCRFGTRPPVDDRFAVLAKSICSQQLAGAAARTIWGRVQLAVGEPFEPERVLATSDDALRAAGLSRAKLAALRDLAVHVADGRVDLRRIGSYDDEAVIAMLVPVRGIGRWTAEMFCIFALHRLDVWPVDDLGVRHGYGAAHGLAEMPTRAELAAAGERFRPFRSIAAWYCWRASDAARARNGA